MGFATKIVNSIEELPTLPTIYLRLLEVFKNPNVSSREIADVISTDPSSAAKVLKHVNTPFFGLKKECGSLTQAVNFLGYNEIKNLVLGLTIIKMFDKVNSLNDLNIVDFWKHSIAVGVATRIIGIKANIQNIENYLISGLLHDIGKIVFIIHFYNEYSELIYYAKTNNKTIDEAETMFFGTSHLLVGELIAERWMLPQSIRKAIRYHRTGFDDSNHSKLVAAVHIADVYARTLNFGDCGDYLIPRPEIKALEELDLPDTFFMDTWDFFSNEYNNSIKILLNY
jgi:HD-like signal output (HDOD) protein